MHDWHNNGEISRLTLIYIASEITYELIDIQVYVEVTQLMENESIFTHMKKKRLKATEKNRHKKTICISLISNHLESEIGVSLKFFFSV